MPGEIIPVPQSPVLQGVGAALRQALPLHGHDREEQAERHELRRMDIGEAVRK